MGQEASRRLSGAQRAVFDQFQEAVVHDLYFNPKYEEFRPRTMWDLSNTFTVTFKERDPIPPFKSMVELSAFFENVLAA